MRVTEWCVYASGGDPVKLATVWLEHVPYKHGVKRGVEHLPSKQRVGSGSSIPVSRSATIEQ